MQSPYLDDPRKAFPLPEKKILYLDENEALTHITNGEVIGGHTMPWGSNYTFLLWIAVEENQCIRAIYKPRDGEKPLRDFPSGTLYKREQAAYELSKLLKWPNIPLTVVRDGPYGVGSMQLYLDCDPRTTYFDMRDTSSDDLFPVAVFDLLVNNADRKAGHCLLDATNNIWSIDHGLTFHSSFKMRTVMLEYCGREIPKQLVTDMKNLSDSFTQKSQILETLINQEEIQALQNRLAQIIETPMMPILDPNVNIPWPLV
ncbi:MAG TPA: hypothetical protein DEP04_11120 [Dehalococcoidia bacterium]|nr:hypothetical protein [Chloroflexota bacterium]HCE77167.1 hypothetical protein [Dehalococcoidia bacterium]|tara:strand:- start:150 stop:923 length:774 start_codon:yes stop_codon:yes gene_type:complete